MPISQKNITRNSKQLSIASTAFRANQQNQKPKMKRQQINQTLTNGGRIVNHIVVDSGNQAVGTLTDRQIANLSRDGVIQEPQLHYDNTRTYRSAN